MIGEMPEEDNDHMTFCCCPECAPRYAQQATKQGGAAVRPPNKQELEKRMINRVTLLGNLGADPELRNTPAGKAVASFSLATTSGYGDKEQTEWHNIECWEKVAESVGKFCKKGHKVYLEGRIKTESYEKDGVKRYKTKIVAHEVKFLTPKGENQAAAPDPGFDAF